MAGGHHIWSPLVFLGVGREKLDVVYSFTHGTEGLHNTITNAIFQICGLPFCSRDLRK